MKHGLRVTGPVALLIALFIFHLFSLLLRHLSGHRERLRTTIGLLPSREKFEGQAINVPWTVRSGLRKAPRFWYRKTVKGGHEFILVDAEKATKRPAFDHEKLAAALNKETGEKFTATTLPFRAIRFVDDEKAIGFEYRGSAWRFDLATYELKKTGPAREFRGEPDGWQDLGGPPAQAASKESKASPDKKWEAFIRNYNVWIRSVESREEFPLSWDGNEGDYYTFQSLLWSPDSKKLVASHLRPGLHRNCSMSIHRRLTSCSQNISLLVIPNQGIRSILNSRSFLALRPKSR